MTRLELIYDLKRLLTHSGITDESRLVNNHLGFLIDQRRAKEIRDTFKRNPVIEPIWIQDYGVFTLTSVNKAEDRGVSSSDFKFSKAVLPPVVSITDPIGNVPDLGTYSIRSTCGKFRYDYMNVEQMTLLQSDSMQGKFKYYSKVGNAIYLTPEVHRARALLILDSPLDGYVLDTTNIPSGSLVSGTVYELFGGTVTHNGVRYRKGETFTAANTTYTGSGEVRFSSQKRRMTNDDPYPMSHTMGEVVKLKILTQDFAVERQVVADKSNDSADN